MDDSHIVSLTQIKEFLKINKGLAFKAVSRKEKYDWVNGVLSKFEYFRLKKKDKTIVKKYIMGMAGISDPQLTRLIKRKRKVGKIIADNSSRHKFEKIYKPEDIALLIKTDNLHERMSGCAAKAILKREFEIFKKENYQNISKISASHIYNLRETRQYISHSLTFKKTNPVGCKIGERRKPEPEGKPGFLRIDSVHQGDLNSKKGPYHINIVDETTQWEIVGCVEKISEFYLEPLLKDMLEQFPFVIINFHSDNGSEYINKVVAKLLNKLLIKQTKSRARHSNDNALVEGKNGWVVRKHIGYSYIDSERAPLINQFYKSHFNPYLNFHRPCGFATIIEDPKKKGKLKKIYKTYITPYDKLKKADSAGKCLKSGITFEELDKFAFAFSDNEFAELMQKEKGELFKKFIRQKLQFPTAYISSISGSSLD